MHVNKTKSKLSIIGMKSISLWYILYSGFVSFVFLSDHFSQKASGMGLINNGYHILVLTGVAITTSLVTLPISPLIMYNWYKHQN